MDRLDSAIRFARKSRCARCAICYAPPNGKRLLAQDHCHDTGQIRGFLCMHPRWHIGGKCAEVPTVTNSSGDELSIALFAYAHKGCMNIRELLGYTLRYTELPACED
jgi:hypothetical protein